MLAANCLKTGVPVVLFGRPQTKLFDCVEIDIEYRTEKLTEHLIERGYRNIALFDNIPGNPSRNAFRRSMERAGLSDGLRIISAYSGRMEAAFVAMEDFLRSGEKLPDAVIAINDLGAIGFVAALRKHNISIPQQCAVAGFDNIVFARFCDPPLTSVGYDNTLFSQTVWKLMIRRLRKEETGEAVRERIPQILNIRQST